MKNLYLFLGGLMLTPLAYGANQSEPKGVVTVRLFEEEFMFGGSFNAVSENGRYAVGHSREYTGVAFIWDRETDEAKVIEGSLNNEAYAYGVSNDGTVVGTYVDENVKSTYGDPAWLPGKWKDGVWEAMEMIPETQFFGQGMDGEAKCISPDGRIIGGYIPGKDRKYIPAIWIDGVLQNYEGDPVEGQGSMLFCMSDDGTVWGGKAEFECGAISPAVWTDNGKLTRIAGETWDWDVEEYFFFGMTSSISPNGKYASGNFAYDGGIGTDKPFIWTQEGGREYIASGGVCSVVQDDGTAYGVDGYLGSGFIYKDRQVQGLTSYLQENYEFTGSVGIQYVLGASKDNSVLVGWNAFFHPMAVVMQPAIALIEGIGNGIASAEIKNNTQVYVIENQLHINYNGVEPNGTIKVYDSVGVCITEAEAGIDVINLPGSGVYVVRISDKNGESAQKVIVK